MRKKIITTVLLFIISFIGINVKAEINVVDNNAFMIEKLANLSAPRITSVSSDKDLVIVKSEGNVVGYYYNNSPDLNSAKFTATTSSVFYASVKNGVYYFWVNGSGVNTGNVKPVMYAKGVKISTSCTNQKVKNCTKSGLVERCFIYTGGDKVSAEIKGDLVVPANGYKIKTLKVNTNNCSNISLNVGNQRLERRYCKIVYAYECVKDNGGSGGGGGETKDDCTTNPNKPGCQQQCTGCACTNSCATIPYLTGLSVSPGVLSPAFNTKTVAYKVVVGGDVDKITINAVGSRGNAAGNITGTGTYQLSVGSQKFKISISNNAATIDYYVEVIRENNKSKDNKLNSLEVSTGELSPAFNPDVDYYEVEVENDVTSININASIRDSKARFTDNLGSRKVELTEGVNQIPIKVMAESGDVQVYNIMVNRKSLDLCAIHSKEKALLREIVFTTSNKEIEEMPVIKDISEDQFYFPNITIPFETINLQVQAATVTEGDTYVVNGLDKSFVAGVPNDIEIVVTSAECPSITKTYTLNVTKEEEVIKDSDATLARLTVVNHDEFKFKQETNSYTIKLKKKEKSLKVQATPNSATTTCTDDSVDEKGNARSLVVGSVITIKCIAEDGTSEVYTIKVTAVQKSTNAFLVVLIIIIIILLLIYLVLRLLGYKIIINGEVIGNFFRGIGEKFRNLFDK